MNGKRSGFGMLNVNDTLFAIGGWGSLNGNSRGSLNTMETIKLSYDTEWKQEKLDFSIANHCMVNIGSKIYIVGISGLNQDVSKII